MNILYVVHAYKPSYRVGGPVVSVSAAAEALVRKGHHVTVMTTNSNLDEELDVPVDQPIDVDGVTVWYFRREEPLQRFTPFLTYLTKSIGYLYCPAMRPALDRLIPHFDIVDTHMPFVYPTYAAAHAAFRHDKPLFYHQRGNFDPQRLKFRGFKKKVYMTLVEQPIMRRATTLIALTEAERMSFDRIAAGVPVAVVPNGIDVPAPRPEAANRVEAAFGIPPSAPMVLFVGRLHPIKGAEKLLDAFARIALNFPEARLVMAGPDEWHLQGEWARTFGATSRQVIFPGMVRADMKADLFARADLFALPSVGEGFSMAVLEALASGTAAMLSPGCNFPEAAAAGAAVIVEPEPATMADAIGSLLRDRDSLVKMGLRGQELVRSQYSWDVISDRLLQVYAYGVQSRLRGRA